ncbi:DUF883 family protein [Bordetella hinzii]|uniref:DUF883 domain-containing protein n=2 Tax=Bordetella hinzii TaxID=103855 RepID=A0AAN1RYW0_9BORD|nr:DUF883 family protein [Bordetella hinzii]AKQ60232.1 hypothetical protein ACR55_02364 [Bordetella hinzii]AZW18696.1 DUF883 domain-containing protein [Bordetella hinzii]KCB24546.1 PF05957 family protein [Bordetella hinzii OH87 BAL007II]KCB34277.1 PF05957 family protein [Bordetella hinzii CA90 BAL1384]KCB39446.1 PF05957 family protein [Bordetella hinzii 5132]
MHSKHHRDGGTLDRLLHGTEELLRRTAAFGDADIEAGRDRLKRQWDAAGERAADWSEAAGQGLRRVTRAADDCAHRHAWESIAVAALVGAVVTACVLTRSSRR